MVALTVVLLWRIEAEARQQAISQIRLRGEGVARMLAINSADELGRFDDLRLAQFVVDAAGLPDVLYALVVDAEGIVVAHSEFEEGGIGKSFDPAWEDYETVKEAMVDRSFTYEGQSTRDIGAPIITPIWRPAAGSARFTWVSPRPRWPRRCASSGSRCTSSPESPSAPP